MRLLVEMRNFEVISQGLCPSVESVKITFAMTGFSVQALMKHYSNWISSWRGTLKIYVVRMTCISVCLSAFIASCLVSANIETEPSKYIVTKGLKALPEKGQKNSESNLRVEHRVGDAFYRWHTWRHSSSCSPDNKYGVETNEPTVQSKCGNHTIESYKHVKVKVAASGPDKVIKEYACSRCHLFGEHRENNHIPDAGGIDVLYLESKHHRQNYRSSSVRIFSPILTTREFR